MNMKISSATRVYLAISGLIGIAIGGALLLVPVELQASAGVILGDNINLLSDTRAAGGTIFAAGCVIALGIIVPKMAHTSLVISSLIYVSYGVSRGLGIIIDGMPDNALVAAAGVEATLGMMGLVLLYQHRQRQQHNVR